MFDTPTKMWITDAAVNEASLCTYNCFVSLLPSVAKFKSVPVMNKIRLRKKSRILKQFSGAKYQFLGSQKSSFEQTHCVV